MYQTLRPVLVFIWDRLLAKGIDAMAVFGTYSKGSPATSRVAIFQALGRLGSLRIIDLAEHAGLNVSTMSHHVDYLRSAHLVDRESAALLRGEAVTEYRITKAGHATLFWPPFEKIHDNKVKRETVYAKEVAQAVRSLSAGNIPITSEAVTQYINDNLNPTTPRGNNETSTFLGYYAKRELLETGTLHRGNYANVTLAPLGIQIYEDLVEPLMRWSNSPFSVAEINEIAKILSKNPDAFNHLYPQIAASFIKTSPSKNRDPLGKLAAAITLVQDQEGNLSVSDIGRQIEVSRSRISALLRPHIEKGTLAWQNPPRGARRTLIFGEQKLNVKQEA